MSEPQRAQFTMILGQGEEATRLAFPETLAYHQVVESMRTEVEEINPKDIEQVRRFAGIIRARAAEISGK